MKIIFSSLMDFQIIMQFHEINCVINTVLYQILLIYRVLITLNKKCIPCLIVGNSMGYVSVRNLETFYFFSLYIYIFIYIYFLYIYIYKKHQCCKVILRSTFDIYNLLTISTIRLSRSSTVTISIFFR